MRRPATPATQGAGDCVPWRPRMTEGRLMRDRMTHGEPASLHSPILLAGPAARTSLVRLPTAGPSTTAQEA